MAMKSREISRENTSFSLIMRHQPVTIWPLTSKDHRRSKAI